MRYPLAGLLYLACIVVPIVQPWDGVGLYLLLAAVRPQNITYGFDVIGGRYSLVALACIVVGWGLRIMVSKPRWGPFFVLLILFSGQLMLSRVYALDAYAAREQFMMMFIPIVFAVIIVQVVRTPEQLYRVLWFLAIGLGFLGFWAFWKYHFTNLYEIESDGEITGPGGMLIDRNDFSLGLNMGLPLIFYLGLAAKKRWAQVVSILCMAPSAITVLETGSRGAFLGLGAIGCYILYKMHHKRWVIALAVVAVIGGLMVIPPEYYQRYGEITSAAQEDSSAQTRLISWAAAISMASHHPLTGVGLGCFTVDYFTYAPDAEVAFVAHNSFFQILGTAGIPGAALWLAIVARMWFLLGGVEKRLKRARMKGSRLHYMALALRTSLLAYVICGFFLSMEDLEFFYYEVGLAAALDLAVRKEVALKKEQEEAEQETEWPLEDGVPAAGLAP